MLKISEVRAALALTREHLLDVGGVACGLIDVLCRLQLTPNFHAVTDMEVAPAAATLVSDGSQNGIVFVPEILTKEGHIVCHGDGLGGSRRSWVSTMRGPSVPTRPRKAKKRGRASSAPSR